MTSADSPTTPPQASGTQTGDKAGAEAAMTDEQVRTIADQVYAMLLHDLRQERERDRTFLHSRSVFRGVR